VASPSTTEGACFTRGPLRQAVPVARDGERPLPDARKRIASVSRLRAGAGLARAKSKPLKTDGERLGASMLPSRHVRFGSKADIADCGSDVRYEPKGQHRETTARD